MSIFSDISNITSKKRKLEVPEPKTNLFVRGIVLFALGLLGASVYTIEDIDQDTGSCFPMYWGGFDHSWYNFFDLLWKTGDSI